MEGACREKSEEFNKNVVSGTNRPIGLKAALPTVAITSCCYITRFSHEAVPRRPTMK